MRKGKLTGEREDGATKGAGTNHESSTGWAGGRLWTRGIWIGRLVSAAGTSNFSMQRKPSVSGVYKDQEGWTLDELYHHYSPGT